MLKLIIEDDEGRKTVVPFVRDEITIGRQEGNTIRLTERNVSRRHARLLRSNGAVTVEDLGSYNGIRINGEKVAGRANVGDGDLIQIGDYDLAIQHEGQDGQPVHSPPPPPEVTAPNGQRANGANGSSAHHEAATETSMPAYEEAEPISAESELPPTAKGKAMPAPAAEPSGDSRRQATAIIRVDQIEAQRNRQVADLDPEEAPRLVVINTEFAGKEFACIRTELRIGRTDDNDINLDHRSLSRTHAKIVREENGEWRVIDMQSANGLMVNGESYAQATLNHLDTLELGHVKLKFVGAGESYTYVPGKEDRPGAAAEGGAKSKTPLIIGGAAIIAVIAAAGVFIAIGRGKDTTTPPVPTKLPEIAKNTSPVKTPQKSADTQPEVAVKTPTPPPDAPEVKTPPKEDPSIAAAAEVKKALDAAQADLEAKNLDGAIAKLDDAKKIPNADKASMSLVEDALDKAKGEKLMLQRLDSAEKSLGAGKLDQAKKLLADASATEVFQDRYSKLNDQLEAKLADEEAKKAAAAAKAAEKQPEKTPEKVAEKTPEKTVPAKATANGNDAETQRLFEEGKKLLAARQIREAKASLNKCVDINPRFAQCHLLLGAAYAKLNDPDAGAKHYEIFLKLAPDAPEAPRVKMMLEQYKGLKK